MPLRGSVLRWSFFTLTLLVASLVVTPPANPEIGPKFSVFLLSPVLNTPMPSGSVSVQFRWVASSSHTSCCRGTDNCYAALLPNDSSPPQQMKVPNANSFGAGTHTVPGFVTSTRDEDGRRNYRIQVDVACAVYLPPPGATQGHGSLPSSPFVATYTFETLVVDDN